MKFSSSLFTTALLSLLLPSVAFASGGLSADDTVVGLGVTVHVVSAGANQPVVLSVQPPKGTAFTVQGQTAASGNADIDIPGKQTRTAGTYTVTASVGGKDIGSPLSVAVLPDSVDPDVSQVQAWTPRIRSDGRDSADVEVTLRDHYGNVLPGRIATLVSGRSEDTVTALTPETDAQGVQHFSVRTTLAGIIQLRAVDLLSGLTLQSSANVQAGNGVAMGGNGPAFYGADSAQNVAQPSYGGQQFYASVTQGFDVIDAFEITGPDAMDLGVEETITVRAIDKNGLTVQDYAGTVVFESTDPSAILPNRGRYTFKSRDQGEKKFPLGLAFNTPGKQTLRAYDSENKQPESGPIGTITIAVGGHGAAAPAGITVTSPKEGDTIGGATVTVEGIGPRFANLIVSGGASVATGSSDADGKFSITVSLSSSQKNVTLDVQDDLKRNDSGPIHIVVDNTPPQIGSITFSPEKPNPGDKVLVVVQTDPHLQQVSMKLALPDNPVGQSVTLTENSTGSGTYQAFFNAPETGAYTPTVTAMDKAGNISTQNTTFTVGQKSLPTVQNVKAEARVNAVGLQWDAVTIPVDGYRVYVGDSKDNYLYNLDTNRVTTKATVAGLTPGKQYFFAVTALKGNLESEQKSEPVSSQVLGLTLNVIPGNGALGIKWTALSSSVQVGTYALQYGTDPDTYTETRTLNGQIRETTIRDLINNVTYYVKLTPITVTGDRVEELSAKGQGMPVGTGFTPGPRDDIPFVAATNPGDTLTPAPKNVSTGMPMWAWVSALILGCAGGLWGWTAQQSARRSAAFLKTLQAQYGRKM